MHVLPFLLLCLALILYFFIFFFFQAEDGIRDYKVTGVQTCALPISRFSQPRPPPSCRRPWRSPGDSPRPGPTRRGGLPGRDRKSVVVGKECRSRWSPYH